MVRCEHCNTITPIRQPVRGGFYDGVRACPPCWADLMNRPVGELYITIGQYIPAPTTLEAENEWATRVTVSKNL